MSSSKERLDQILVTRGLVATRHKAQSLIMRGAVLVDERPQTKPGIKINIDSEIRVRHEEMRYVSRGGDKIEHAFNFFHSKLEDVVAIDVGASTGGFTDCMLQRGAKLVYAVDVGTNQLDFRLRSDRRVVVMEKIHARDLLLEMFPEQPTFATIDVSFIALKKILPQVISVLKKPADVICLVKPQFEVGREHVGSGGLVKDEKVALASVHAVADFSRTIGAQVLGMTPSVLRGEKSGNQEYFLSLRVI